MFYLLNFTHHGHFNVTWVHTSPISFVACRKVSLFHFFACNKLNEIADICMQAWRMSLTNLTVCQTLSLMLMIDGLTLLYNWHYWYQCCEIWDLSALADKVGIVFETSFAENWWWQFCFWKIDSHWKLFTINRPSNLSLLNEKSNGLTTNDW